MIRANSVEQGIKTLLNKNFQDITNWRIESKSADNYTDTLIIAGGEKVPLLWWRYRQKLTGVFNIARSRLGALCSVKSYAFEPITMRLDDVLYREIDLAQWWLGTKAEYIMGFETGECGNYAVKMLNGTVANLEITCTLPALAPSQHKRTVFGTEGMASDMVVDNMIAQPNVHLFNDGACPKAYNDTESWMYGLSQDDTERAYCAAMLLMGKENVQEYVEADAFTKRAAHAARMSAANTERIYIREAKK